MNTTNLSFAGLGCVALVLISCAAGTAEAQDFSISEGQINVGKQQYSPYLYQSYPNRVFWGDTHIHTSYSTDARTFGYFPVT